MPFGDVRAPMPRYSAKASCDLRAAACSATARAPVQVMTTSCDMFLAGFGTGDEGRSSSRVADMVGCRQRIGARTPTVGVPVRVATCDGPAAGTHLMTLRGLLL